MERMPSVSETDNDGLKDNKILVTEKNSMDENLTKLKPTLTRPPSSRPAAPQRKTKNESLDANIIQIVRKDPILTENTKGVFDVEMEENIDDVILFENPQVKDINATEVMGNTNLVEGHLVQQILQTQHKLNNNDTPKPRGHHPEAELLSSGSLKEENLKSLIQKLTKSVNPLGNLLDCIQEDIDVMQIEVNHQKTIFNDASSRLLKQKFDNEAGIRPFTNQLLKLNHEINSLSQLVHDKRCFLVLNSKKIEKVITDL